MATGGRANPNEDNTFGRDYGDEYGEPFDGGIVPPVAPPAGEPPPVPPAGALGLPGNPQGDQIDPAVAAQAEATQADQVDQAPPSGAALGNLDPTTRTVQDNELTSKHLEGLVSGDSTYIQNARQRAAELSNRRGQFTSNLFAGSAERAAVEAALPIAQSDAQAFMDAATQNLTVKNQNAIANIQRAAQLDTALINSATQINVANLDANTRVSIANMDNLARVDIANLDAKTRENITKMTNATQLLLQNMQSDLEIEMQSRNLTHDAAMEEYRQNGKLQLAEMDAALRTKLTEAGFAHDIDLANLTAAENLRLQTVINEYDIEKQGRDHNFNDRQSHINMAMQSQINYINYLSSFAGTEMDAAAASRLQQQADNMLIASFEILNGLYPNQPKIEVEFNTDVLGG